MQISIPADQFPRIRSIGVNVWGVAWYGVVVANFSTRSQAHSFVKYLKFVLRRLGKAFVIDGTDLTQQLTAFLANAANPAVGFNPNWNVL
jgi:hypothetical protein